MKNIFNSLDGEGFLPNELKKEMKEQPEELRRQIVEKFAEYNRHYREDDLEIVYDVWNQMGYDNDNEKFYLWHMYYFFINKVGEMIKKEQYFGMRTILGVFTTKGSHVFNVSVEKNIEFLRNGFALLLTEPEDSSSFHFVSCSIFFTLIQDNDNFANENITYIEEFKERNPALYNRLRDD